MLPIRRSILPLLLSLALLTFVFYYWQRFSQPAPWTDAELQQIASLSLAALPPLPPDPSNAVADDPRAAEFGHRLFFDPRLSANGNISCATCHQPIRNFSDGLPRAVALGMSKRNTPSIAGSAYSPWFYWDGRKDSQWSQALAPLEDPNEHGSSRLQVISLIASVSDYRRRYETLFGQPPRLESQDDINRAFANVGKALAAYERKLMPGKSRFDRYADYLQTGGDPKQQDLLNKDEIAGLRLFIGAARCTECHNGPLFTNFEFHNTGLLPPAGELPDRGRIDGVREVLQDPFNCLGQYSDDPAHNCPELRYVRTGPELIGATRTPSLRNLANTMPFQSKGQHATLSGVLEHYNRAPLAMIGHNEATELGLADWQLRQLEAFLGTLAAPIDAAPEWLKAPATD